MSAPDALSFLIREADCEYRKKSKENLSSHLLADFRKCPELYHRKRLGLIPDDDRPAFLMGRASHTLILEGRSEFDSRYAVGGPINARTGKPYGTNTQAYEDWASEQAAQGHGCLSQEQFSLVVNLTTGVKAHPLAFDLLSSGVAEGVVRAEYCGTPCQSRIDWFHPERGIVDLKSCDDLTWFEADARRYGYGHQLAFYRAMVERVTGVIHPVHLVAIEKKEPFRCGVWVISEQTLAQCQRENEAAIGRLLECIAKDSWPTGYEECRVFDL